MVFLKLLKGQGLTCSKFSSQIQSLLLSSNKSIDFIMKLFHINALNPLYSKVSIKLSL